jgi:hypothetical protein
MAPPYQTSRLGLCLSLSLANGRSLGKYLTTASTGPDSCSSSAGAGTNPTRSHYPPIKKFSTYSYLRYSHNPSCGNAPEPRAQQSRCRRILAEGNQWESNEFNIAQLRRGLTNGCCSTQLKDEQAAKQAYLAKLPSAQPILRKSPLAIRSGLG